MGFSRRQWWMMLSKIKLYDWWELLNLKLTFGVISYCGHI
jgi:hypothetical protein